MRLVDPAQLMAAANADPEFRLAARYWDTTLNLATPESALVIEIAAGEVTRCSLAMENSAGAFTVAGPESGWAEFLAPVPRAFYQDLLGGAVGRHGFSISGDLSSFAAYYQASQRLFGIMRELRAAKEMTHAAVR